MKIAALQFGLILALALVLVPGAGPSAASDEAASYPLLAKRGGSGHGGDRYDDHGRHSGDHRRRHHDDHGRRHDDHGRRHDDHGRHHDDHGRHHDDHRHHEGEVEIELRGRHGAEIEIEFK